jgi:hypothetical protein
MPSIDKNLGYLAAANHHEARTQSCDSRVRRPCDGHRVVYYFVESRALILLLLVYPKNVQDDLTAEQKRMLKELVRRELEQEGDA